MKWIGLLLLILGSGFCRAQSIQVSGADTADEQIKTATRFLIRYLSAFEGRRTPEYSHYWSKGDCLRSGLPDDMAFAISDNYSTYWMGGSQPSIFFARSYTDYVHLKVLVASSDSDRMITPWAITNHYVRIDTQTGQARFVSELELHRRDYREVKNRNITYHFPASLGFSNAMSNAMLDRLKTIEQQWGFAPLEIHYYYAPNAAELAKMRGMDYNFAMDAVHPSGISYPKNRKLFCQGLGEGYLHEVLHLYFNPVYEQSPMCHAMIYYLAGGLGKDFEWFIGRMNEYLIRYPETDLSKYESMMSEDKMLHIDYVVKGLLCKMIDEKDGIAGLKRAMGYASVDTLLQQEFGIAQKDLNTFLRKAFSKYSSGNVRLSTEN
jgi:hypothetical protein